jgi:hypothetical protein
MRGGVPFADSCTKELVTVPNSPAWGCSGFTGANNTACVNLLSCVRGNGPQGKCLNGNDPTPCLCGALDPGTCVTSGAPTTAPCAAQYVAATLAGTSVFVQFNDPSSPVGIANNLVACDVDAPCAMQCMLK